MSSTPSPAEQDTKSSPATLEPGADEMDLSQQYTSQSHAASAAHSSTESQHPPNSAHPPQQQYLPSQSFQAQSFHLQSQQPPQLQPEQPHYSPQPYPTQEHAAPTLASGLYGEPHHQDIGDPEVTKVTSSLWRRAGQLQATLGTWTGVESWENSGRSTEAWANDTYQQATEKSTSGEPSRIHGEYNRWMGYVGKAVGHIAGDPEMEAKASMRTREGEEEVNKVLRQDP